MTGTLPALADGRTSLSPETGDSGLRSPCKKPCCFFTNLLSQAQISLSCHFFTNVLFLCLTGIKACFGSFLCVSYFYEPWSMKNSNLVFSIHLSRVHLILRAAKKTQKLSPCQQNQEAGSTLFCLFACLLAFFLSFFLSVCLSFFLSFCLFFLPSFLFSFLSFFFFPFLPSFPPPLVACRMSWSRDPTCTTAATWASTVTTPDP